MMIPNGRYTFHLQGERFTVRVTCPQRKRWTKLEIWVVDKWFEITNPDNKKVILAKLRDVNTDLSAASRQYSITHRRCGICGNELKYGETVGACWEKTFGKDRVNG